MDQLNASYSEDQTRDEWTKNRAKNVPMTKKQVYDMYGETTAAKTLASLEQKGAWINDPNVPGEKLYLVRKDISETGNMTNDRISAYISTLMLTLFNVLFFSHPVFILHFHWPFMRSAIDHRGHQGGSSLHGSLKGGVQARACCRGSHTFNTTEFDQFSGSNRASEGERRR